MKKGRFLITGTVGMWLVVLLLFPAFAQRGGRIHYSDLFNPATLGTISGKVVSVEKTLSGNSRDYCVHATVQTGKGLVKAVFAPLSFMQKENLTIAPGDRLTLQGSMITVMGKPYILVTEVTGDRTMKLREPNGRPAWAVGDDWHAR